MILGGLSDTAGKGMRAGFRRIAELACARAVDERAGTGRHQTPRFVPAAAAASTGCSEYTHANETQTGDSQAGGERIPPPAWPADCGGDAGWRDLFDAGSFA